MAIDADRLVADMITARSLTTGAETNAACAKAINRAIVSLNNDAGQDIDELTGTSGTLGDIDLDSKYGNALQQLADYYLERSPFWKREDRLVSEGEKQKALGDARKAKGYNWGGPNQNYDSKASS